MDLSDHFRMLARYNRIANERLYDKCSALSDEEYRLKRAGSFGSIHALLNHILLGDRIWMSRFEGGGQTTPRLNTVLQEDFFNHQTHHRGQVHVMLSQTAIAPPSLDLHRIINP